MPFRQSNMSLTAWKCRNLGSELNLIHWQTTNFAQGRIEFVRNFSYLLLLLLLNGSLCPDGVRTVERGCYKPCTYAKYTLYSVPIWFITLLFTHCRCPISGCFPFYPPFFIPPANPRTNPPPPPQSPLPPPVQVLPVPTTPPHPHPCPPLPLCCLTQVHNCLHHNIMCGRLLYLLNVGLHKLKSRLLSCYLHQGVLPFPAQPPPWKSPYHLPRHLLL